MARNQIGTQARAQNKDFGAVSQTDVNRSLVHLWRRLLNKKIPSWHMAVHFCMMSNVTTKLFLLFSKPIKVYKRPKINAKNCNQKVHKHSWSRGLWKGVLLLHPEATCGSDSKGVLCFPVSPPLRKQTHNQVTKEADIFGKVSEYTREGNFLNFLQGCVAGCTRTLDLTMQSWICDSHKDFSVIYMSYIGHRVVTVPKCNNRTKAL